MLQKLALNKPAFFSIAYFLLISTLLAQTDVEREIPKLNSRVTDLSGLLSSSDQSFLSSQLEALEKNNKIQMAILVVPDTGYEDIEQFSIRVAESWKLGSKRDDNGLLLVINTGGRRMRLEVGYGLEGMLPDLRAKRIIDNVLVPAFKEQQYSQGISSAIGAIAKLSEGETDSFEALTQGRHSSDDEEVTFLDFIFFIFIVGIIILSKGRVLILPGGSGGSYSGGSFGGGGGFSGGGGGFGGGGASGSW